MEKKEPLGFFKLASKSLAVLFTSFGTLTNQGKALSLKHLEDNDKGLNYNEFQKKILKPQLILKLNLNNTENSFLAMHVSHSSHSSHRSHSSHNSHNSHYSSSPTYSPSSSPTYSPTSDPTDPTDSPSSSPNNHPSTSPRHNSSKHPKVSPYYILGSRILYKGCEGTDVEGLQKILLKLGYDISVTGYFGDKTEMAVKKFQKENEINPDGKVGNKTLEILQNKKLER